MSQIGSSNTSSAQHGKEPAHSGEPSRQTAACRTSQRRKPRTQTKWPNDVVKVEGIDGDGFPTNDNGLKWWRLICGLIARQRVGINVKFEDVDQPTRQGLFEIMKEYLEFLEGTFEAQMNHVRGAALKSIAKLHRHFKSNLPFEVHKHLDHRDWKTFIETTTSEQFLEKSERFKNLHGRITDNHRLGPEGYARKEKGKCRKEDTAMKEAGIENPWRQFPGRSSTYLRARADPTPSTGEITWSSNSSKRLADRVIELKDQEIGVREKDILSTAIDTPEHRGHVHGVSSLKGWKEGYRKDNEGLWKKKKRIFMDPDRLKIEIMDEIFGKLRAAGIDVDAALGTSIGKSSCASKEVEQPLIVPAGVNTSGHHNHYITHAMHKENPSIVGEFKARDLHSGPGYLSVAWSDLYDLFNLDALDISLIRCLALQLNKESKERQLGVAFIDPQQFSAAIIAQDPDHCIPQGSGNECGFFVAYHMIWLTATFKNLKGAKDMQDDKDKKLEKKQLLAIREKVASFLLVDVISDKGSRWLPNPTCAPGCSRKPK
ncbi:hypothetical protein C2845_PM03G30140 [Panicum miliaceum]|uniref:Ubiquitin-like protease family profile domain-containing protein n=1 Tax=Panicum miliaceum TaxID=4540 RepID=A0A3L6T9E3_PANMI|nr:hypothetical protein C2845_PM03G30140 [Panicum miliaceum]